MKRLWREERWLRYQRKRRRKATKRRRRHRPYRRQARRAPAPRRLGPDGPVVLAAPACCSIVENPEDTVRFLNRVTHHADRGDRLHIGMKGITSLTIDAIMVLIAKLVRGKRYSGTFPEDVSARKLLEESGFMAHVRGQVTLAKAAHGSLQEQQNDRVEADVAARLVAVVTEGLYGSQRWAKGVQRTLVEAMTNTRHHARGERGRPSHRETWWAMAHFDEESRRGTFAFVDQGVGICASLRLKLSQRVRVSLGLLDNASLLQAAFDGEIGSRTGLGYRGLGLPRMLRDVHAGEVSDLRVITNDVYGDIGKGQYRRLGVPFKGTLISFTVGRTMEKRR